MVKKWGRERFYISCNYSCTISFLVKILLVKLKNLYIQYAWISVMKKQNSNQNVKIEKMVVFAKTFDYYHHKFNFGNFFICPVKLQNNLKLKFRSKFNHAFTIIMVYFHSAEWKASYNFKVKWAQDARDNQFLFQNVKIMRFLRSSKCSKTTVELTFTTQKASACSPWTACSVFDWKYPFWVNWVQKLKIISLSWILVLRLIQIWRIPWYCSLFLFSARNTFLW